MANNKEVYLTEEGLNDLKRELDELINVKRPANIQAIKEARSYGDLSENAEYDAARNEQAQIEARVKELERMLEASSTDCSQPRLDGAAIHVILETQMRQRYSFFRMF